MGSDVSAFNVSLIVQGGKVTSLTVSVDHLPVAIVVCINTGGEGGGVLSFVIGMCR